MIEYRIYTKPKGKAAAKQRLADTAYRPDDATARAGKLALTGLWVTIVQTDVADPSRWD